MIPLALLLLHSHRSSRPPPPRAGAMQRLHRERPGPGGGGRHSGNKIAFVGRNGMPAAGGPNTRVVDLRGAAVSPDSPTRTCTRRHRRAGDEPQPRRHHQPGRLPARVKARVDQTPAGMGHGEGGSRPSETAGVPHPAGPRPIAPAIRWCHSRRRACFHRQQRGAPAGRITRTTPAPAGGGINKDAEGEPTAC